MGNKGVMTPVSVCCLTFNCERTVRKTLDSIRQIADEIIIVDSYSTDSTIEIVKEYADKIYFRPYQYHGTQMNYALDQCSFDWAFCIDSDEAIDNVMAQHIFELKQSGMEGKEAYRLFRKWFFLGRPVHAFYPASSPDRITRFFDRRIVRFNEDKVHDKPVGHTKCSWLKGTLIHDTTGSLHELYEKLNRYTTYHAQLNPGSASKVRLPHLILRPFGAFIKWYVFKKNFLDGYQGLVLGTYAAMYTFLKYVKLYHARMKSSLP